MVRLPKLARLTAGLLVLADAGIAQGEAAGQRQAVDLPWPDYRGPAADGHALAAGVPLKWSEKQNVTFRVEVPGRGWSSPVIGGGRVFLTSAPRDGKQMFAYAFDVNTGKQVFARKVLEIERPARVNTLNSYASPSAVLDAECVYVHFGSYGTICLRQDTGVQVWKRTDLRCDHMEGPGSTPILYRDLLVFNVDGGDVQYVIGLDKATGKTRWRTPRSVDLSRLAVDRRKAFSTPIVIQVLGRPRLISSGAEATVGYDPRSGEELWRVRHPGFSMSARPLFADGVLYLNTGFMSSRIFAVKASGEGDVTAGNVLWQYRRSVPRMSTGLLVAGRLYMVSDGGIVSCVDAKDGQLVWRKRIGNQHAASPVYAGGRIYFFDREGRTTVIAPGDTCKILATNELATGFMASPAVVGDAFVLRTRHHLYRIETPRGR